MKKVKLLLVLFLCSSYLLNAQEQTTSLGMAFSYDIFSEDGEFTYLGKNNVGVSYGIEYSEKKGMFGYRTGIFYSRLNDQLFTPQENYLFLRIAWNPVYEPLEMVDFPISGQVYLGKKRLQAYASLGLSTSLAFYKDNTFNWLYDKNNDSDKSLSFKSIFGLGLSYQLGKHIGLDVNVNRRTNLYTLDNHYLKPRNIKYSFQTTINYIF